jgi:hypothetical protein
MTVDWVKHLEHSRERLRSALAPLTAPNPAESARIEEAIHNVIQAEIGVAMQHVLLTARG